MGGQDGRHWEGLLIPRNVALCDAYDKGCPASLAIPKLYNFGKDRQQYAELSINHWKMGITAELARAAAYDPGAYDAAAAVVHDWLDGEDQAWWLNEQCAGGGHPGMHAQAELQALRGTYKRGDAILSMRLTSQVKRLLAVCNAVTTPKGSFVCVGERQEGSGPELPQLSALHRIVNGMPPQGQLAKNPGDLKTDAYFLCARIAASMKAEGKMPRVQPGAPLPRMRRPLTVVRGRGFHLTSMAALPKTGAPQQWAIVDHAVADAAERDARGITVGTGAWPALQPGQVMKSPGAL